MAEARRATIIEMSSEAHNTNNTKAKTLQRIWHSYLHSSSKQYHLFLNRVSNGLYPSKPKQSIVIIGGVFIASALNIDLSFGIIEKIELGLNKHFVLNSPRDHIISIFIFSLGAWAVISTVRKRLLRRLLTYHGYMWDEFGKRSFNTKLWFYMMKIVSIHSTPSLYSYQGCLPSLPVPKLKHTINSYLESMKPLLDEQQYKGLEKLAMEYKRKHGFIVQCFLYLKYLVSPNYVSDWWENFVYLLSRSPLIIYSNYYGMDSIFVNQKWLQSARAANLVCAAVQCMHEIRTEKLTPIMILNVVPLCSSQYYRVFGTTRIPRFVGPKDTSGDEILHLNTCNYIVVLHNGRFYQVFFKDGRRNLEPVEVEDLIKRILLDHSEVSNDELLLPVLTAGERNHWASTRKNFFSSGVNKESLTIIERAAFILVLEDYEVNYDPKNDSKLDEYAHALLHGKGYDRWFDKSFNLIIFKNGKIGFNAEHSWADAPIMGHFWEYVLMEDAISPKYGYGADGHCRGVAKKDLPSPIRLKWNITAELSEAIKTSMTLVQELINDVELHILIFDTFGKGIMKKFKVSPDGFIQMALQLTYFKVMGEFCQTYEASMTRLYREGRTETVRSCTMESCAFVRAMTNPDISNKDKVKLFRIAADHHQILYKKAMTGQGVDRHLFTQYVVCRFLGIQSEFHKRALAVPWKLSTSQTPHGQTPVLDLKRYPNFISSGGGFGPVADNGYGISYIIAGEDRIFFHISSKKSCPETGSRKFAKELIISMNKVHDIFAK